MTGYDVVVVGAGSAGAVVAARLSADPSLRVLLVEAGPDYRSRETPDAIRGANPGKPLALGRFHWPALRARRTRWQEAQPYPAGRGVGGGSAINGQGAVRGVPADFERWAAGGATGWSWREVLPAFVRIEDDRDFGDRPYHGTGGPIPITRTPLDEWGAVSEALRGAACELGHPRCDDLNAPDGRGLSPITWNRGPDGRVTTNDAYLEAARERANLRVVGDTLAARLVFAGRRASAIELITPAGPERVEAGDFVLCAGALHTPALLLRSGVGPAAELRQAGIDVVADVPGVGRNLQDHALAWLTLPLRPEARVASPDVLPGHCVLRFTTDHDPSLPADAELLALDVGRFDVASGGLMAAAMRPPASRGRVRLASPDPAVDPEVDLGMLAEPADAARLRAAVRTADRISRSRSFADVGDGPLGLDGRPVGEMGDRELDERLRAVSLGYFHPAGTCRMGAATDPRTVVGPDGLALGVEAVRVADASVMPDLPHAPTHLTTVMIAERIAERMLARSGGDGH